MSLTTNIQKYSTYFTNAFSVTL